MYKELKKETKTTKQLFLIANSIDVYRS